MFKSKKSNSLTKQRQILFSCLCHTSLYTLIFLFTNHKLSYMYIYIYIYPNFRSWTTTCTMPYIYISIYIPNPKPYIQYFMPQISSHMSNTLCLKSQVICSILYVLNVLCPQISYNSIMPNYTQFNTFPKF